MGNFSKNFKNNSPTLAKNDFWGKMYINIVKIKFIVFIVRSEELGVRSGLLPASHPLLPIPYSLFPIP